MTRGPILSRLIRAVALALAFGAVARIAGTTNGVAARQASADGAGSGASTAVRYRLSFPEPEHHWMHVEMTLSSLDARPLELRMSRSSPGRYALHDFAKNVYDVEAVDSSGRPLALTRPDPYGWTIAQHPSTVTVRYKVFGDRVDGTYLAVDRTHAHINMPAALMFVRGFDDRPASLTFVPPAAGAMGTVTGGAASRPWRVATQLMPGTGPLEFSAPNLQYLMDSPAEFGPIDLREFSVDGRSIRLAVHHVGAPRDVDSYVRDVEKIVRAERDIFGELPVFEPGYYTFLADYLPWADGDGMEHRNSTVVTSRASIDGGRAGLLGTIAHEFFHAWNVERIRPQSLEPFDFERANLSGELFIAEGFTQYYGPVARSRAGLTDFSDALNTLTGLMQSITLSPGRQFRSPEEMSYMAAFTDGGRPIDRINWASTFISYYSYGGAVAMAMDLSLRGRSGGRVSLDDFMRALWRAHGGAGSRPGAVDRPYTLDAAQARLAEVAGDADFAREFFARFVHGRELPDYGALLQPAGLVLRSTNPDVAWWGDVRLESRGGVRVAAAPLVGTPAYAAGIDLDDEIKTFDGASVSSAGDIDAAIKRRKPGDEVAVQFVDRAGAAHTTRVRLQEDPRKDIVPVERAGGAVTPAQRAFRQAWLGVAS